ncbi:hypothetical protein C922_05509 [Plasmodium inui San Antonio 1]|uniref:Uncharacterized protein n=1 Tax=Plasmodium inui San Antonio 1 TaxID=1237626 RepID=W6ZT70_9APIC|nr:hypothetical protein C922_05509 [Plasmodium inui San Antonio 1]EUD64107.1 hypothetical protein C922_05509 [Plasmodium inui San Antonio 1]
MKQKDGDDRQTIKKVEIQQRVRSRRKQDDKVDKDRIKNMIKEDIPGERGVQGMQTELKADQQRLCPETDAVGTSPKPGENHLRQGTEEGDFTTEADWKLTDQDISFKRKRGKAHKAHRKEPQPRSRCSRETKGGSWKRHDQRRANYVRNRQTTTRGGRDHQPQKNAATHRTQGRDKENPPNQKDEIRSGRGAEKRKREQSRQNRLRTEQNSEKTSEARGQNRGTPLRNNAGEAKFRVQDEQTALIQPTSDGNRTGGDSHVGARFKTEE